MDGTSPAFWHLARGSEDRVAVKWPRRRAGTADSSSRTPVPRARWRAILRTTLWRCQSAGTATIGQLVCDESRYGAAIGDMIGHHCAPRVRTPQAEKMVIAQHGCVPNKPG